MVSEDQDVQRPEGVLTELPDVEIPCELGRENIEESLGKNRSNPEPKGTDFILDEQTLNRRIVDLDSEDALAEFDKIKSIEKTANNLEDIKIDEGMLWHIRLGHPSLNYLYELKITETEFSERAIRAILVGYSRTEYILWEV